MKKLLILLVATLIFAGFAFASEGPAIGDISPNLVLNDLEGNPFNLSGQLGDGPVVLIFFTSWSKSCRNAVQYLSGLEEVKVVGVAFDRDIDALRHYLKEEEIGFSVLSDKKLSTMNDFRLLIIPTIFVINEKGRIKNIYIEFDDNIQKSIEEDLLVS